uniref:Reverse transcriptase zinc-binding domain-containing protein n=1 Tax=Tanacetum cinerariifolium TaxID=118510 RepID=A0A699HXT6_TANCI|nr:hypothetical protein [Tanacetum cinerariifolium]
MGSEHYRLKSFLALLVPSKPKPYPRKKLELDRNINAINDLFHKPFLLLKETGVSFLPNETLPEDKPKVTSVTWDTRGEPHNIKPRDFNIPMPNSFPNHANREWLNNTSLVPPFDSIRPGRSIRHDKLIKKGVFAHQIIMPRLPIILYDVVKLSSTTVQSSLKSVPKPNTTSVALKNSFYSLFDEDASAWGDEATWNNAKQVLEVINESDIKETLLIFIKYVRCSLGIGIGLQMRTYVIKNLMVHKHFVRDWPWCLLGDFNSALYLVDKAVGVSSIDISMREFNECVDDIVVLDVQSSGLHFTWNQKQRGKDGVLKKIDCIMANFYFNDIFVGVHANFKPYQISDHAPLVLCAPTNANKNPKPFKFFNILTSHDRFRRVVADIWSICVSGFAMFKVTQKLKHLKKPFRKLLYEKGNLHANVTCPRNELDRVQLALDVDPFNSSLKEEKAIFIDAFNESRIIRNRIDVVTNCVGLLFENERVAVVFVSHYEQFLGQAGTTQTFDAAELFLNRLDTQDALYMTRAITHQEKEALVSMGNDKAPGPDGYRAAFFKEDWDIIADDVTSAVLEFFINGRLLKELNHTIIDLIPKVRYPARVNDYRHISCCNVLFKCIRKRGLRQGDLLSPYLFTLVMEVLTLMLYRRVRNAEFTYHRYCSRLNLINLCFANNLFLFAHGDAQSTCVIKEALEEFKHASGLDCKELIEKVKARVQDWKNKSLSFAGRIQLIKSVIGSMHIYWASIFIIPNRVLLDLEQIMRDEGGLELRRLDCFNKALIVSHLWKLISMKDLLWDKWVHAYKLRGQSFWDVPIRGFATSYRMMGGLGLIIWDETGVVKPFSVSMVWEADRHRNVKVPWSDIVWFSLCIPRHACNLWLVFWQHLKTQDRICNWELSEDLSSMCSLCETQMDTHEHLFFECSFSQQVWNHMKTYTDIALDHVFSCIVTDLLPFANKRSSRSVISKLVVAACAYFIWKETNSRLFKKKKRLVKQVVDCIYVFV